MTVTVTNNTEKTVKKIKAFGRKPLNLGVGGTPTVGLKTPSELWVEDTSELEARNPLELGA